MSRGLGKTWKVEVGCGGVQRFMEIVGDITNQNLALGL